MKRITATFCRRDLRHVTEALTARAEYIRARLSRDPVLRRAALREARRCARIATKIAAVLGGVG